MLKFTMTVNLKGLTVLQALKAISDEIDTQMMKRGILLWNIWTESLLSEDSVYVEANVVERIKKQNLQRES